MYEVQFLSEVLLVKHFLYEHLAKKKKKKTFTIITNLSHIFFSSAILRNH